MSAASRTLVARRQALIARAAAQRETLRRELQAWRAPLALADHGIGALRYARAHWPWVLGGVLALGALRPARLGLWLYRGWLASRLIYRLRLAPPRR